MKSGIIKALSGEVVTYRKYYAGLKQQRRVIDSLMRREGVTGIQIQIKLESMTINADGTTQRLKKTQ